MAVPRRHRERERESDDDGSDPSNARGFILGDGVPDSVVAARGAGIRVVMITGDYLLTAIAIAKNVTRSWPCPLRGLRPLGQLQI